MTRLDRLALFALVLAVVLSFDAPAYAYLDPGTGSMILQVLLGGVAGMLVIGKLYWHRLKEILGIRSSKDTDLDSVSKADAE